MFVFPIILRFIVALVGVLITFSSDHFLSADVGGAGPGGSETYKTSGDME
jgi:hypothetical protein